jgi:hypothetical protein
VSFPASVNTRLSAGAWFVPGYNAVQFHRYVPRKLGIVTRIFPFPSTTGATGVVSLLLLEDDVVDRLRKNDNGFFLFFGSTGVFFSGSTSIQILPS